MPLTERGTHLKIHSCFCTHGKATGVGTVEIKHVKQLQYWSNKIGDQWSSSGEESSDNLGDPEWPRVETSSHKSSDSDEDLRRYAMCTLKCYYSTVHTVKAERLSMRPIIRNNCSLRYCGSYCVS